VSELPQLVVEKAGLTMLSDRVDVRWGDLTVVEAEYKLFEAAKAKGPYQYYHLLSGVDLPLKSQDYIHEFCDRYGGKEFIGYTLKEITLRLFVRCRGGICSRKTLRISQHLKEYCA